MIEVYVSTDIEADGPVAGKHSMLSIGSAAYTADKDLLATFLRESRNPAELDSGSQDRCLVGHAAGGVACMPAGSRSAPLAMQRYLAWLKSLPGRPVFVAYPAAFDFPFVYWYLMEFAGENPFGYSAIDIKTYAMALLRKPYRACGKRSMPAQWIDPVPHTHVALDDAIEQGQLFCNMLRANGAASRDRTGPPACS